MLVTVEGISISSVKLKQSLNAELCIVVSLLSSANSTLIRFSQLLNACTPMIVTVFGIVMSGSRTVFVLTAVVLIWILIVRAPGRRIILTVLGAGIGVAAVLAVAAGSLGVLERFTNISFSASTFLGRILYAQDALPLILRHPFGLGYYGYYYIQQSIQTGVYSVVNVHNELLQMFLDVGVIPAVVMSAAVLRAVFTKRTDARNRLILVMLILHSLFDYDFQFLAIGFVLILFLDMRNVKTYKVRFLILDDFIVK